MYDPRKPNDPLKSPWLIQRCTIKPFTPKQKVSEFLSYDYMGSSEFEFGMTAKNLRAMFAILDNLEIMEISQIRKAHKTPLCLLAKKEEKQQISEYLLSIANDDGEVRLKEYISLSKIVKGNPSSYARDDFWIDLINNYAFSFQKEALKNFLTALKNSISFMNSKK